MTCGANRRYCDADSHMLGAVDWIAKRADPQKFYFANFADMMGAEHAHRAANSQSD